MTCHSDTTRAVSMALLVVLSVVAGVALAGGATADSTASVHKATEYDGTIELALDSATSNPIQASNVDVWVDGESASVGVGDDGTSGRVTLTGLDDVSPADELVVAVDQPGDLQTGNVSVTVTGDVVTAGNDRVVFAGGPLAFVASDTNVDLDLTREGQFIVERSTGPNSKVYVFDTDGQAVGPNYYINETDGGHGVSTRYRNGDLALTAAANASSIDAGAAVEITTTATGSDRPMVFRLVEDGSSDVVATVETRMDGNGDASVTFRPPSAGSYRVVAVDANTGITAETGTISVGSTDPGEVVFRADIYVDERGDVLDVPVAFEGETAGGRATVTLGSDAVNFLVEATVEDDDGDGEVLLRWNTARSDGANGGVSVAGGSLVSASVEQAVTSPVTTGDYPLAVSVGGTETDLSTAVVRERSTGSVRVLTAPGRFDAFADLSQLRNQATGDDTVALDTLTETHDWLLLQINASGFEGYVTAAGDLDGANGLSLTVEESDETVDSNDDALAIDPGEGTLFADGDADTYYLALKPEHRVRQAEPGDQFQVTLSVDGNANDVSTRSESVTTSFTFVNGTARFDATGERVHLPRAETATLSGTSTFAPGTELEGVLRSDTGNNPFIKRDQTVVVAADGTWSATFDMTNVEQGQPFTARIDKEGKGRVAAPGRVGTPGDDGTATPGDGASTRTGTPTPVPGDATATSAAGDGARATGTPTPVPGDEATPTPVPGAGDDGGTATDGDGSTGVPGFGPGVALAALLAAALLVRRD